MGKALFGLTVAAGLAAWLFAAAGTANANPYKWCAFYSGGRDGGGTNCGFVTIEQCRATIAGIGGSCGLNPFYTGSEQRPAKKSRKRYPS